MKRASVAFFYAMYFELSMKSRYTLEFFLSNAIFSLSPIEFVLFVGMEVRSVFSIFPKTYLPFCTNVSGESLKFLS